MVDLFMLYAIYTQEVVNMDVGMCCLNKNNTMYRELFYYGKNIEKLKYLYNFKK